MERSDQELVRLALRGDQGAYRDLLARHRSRVYSLLRRMVGDVEEAHDLAQETFIRAFSALDSYDPARRFLNWILKIATNLAIDHLRRRHPEMISLDQPLELPGGDATPQIPSSGADPLDHLEAREVRQAVERAIAALPAAYRMVVHLRHVEERSYEEIAEILGLPLGTIKTHLFRARRLLQERLRPFLAARE